MQNLLLPPWIQIALGGLGLAWALSIFAALRTRAGRPSERLNAWGLLIFSGLMVVVGGVRWLGT